MLKNLTELILVFPLFVHGQAYYSITTVYSSTVHKVMGQDLEHVRRAFENKVLPAAVSYVALTRVQNLDCIVPMMKLRKKHFLN